MEITVSGTVNAGAWHLKLKYREKTGTSSIRLVAMLHRLGAMARFFCGVGTASWPLWYLTNEIHKKTRMERHPLAFSSPRYNAPYGSYPSHQLAPGPGMAVYVRWVAAPRI